MATFRPDTAAYDELMRKVLVVGSSSSSSAFFLSHTHTPASTATRVPAIKCFVDCVVVSENDLSFVLVLVVRADKLVFLPMVTLALSGTIVASQTSDALPSRSSTTETAGPATTSHSLFL